MWRFFRFFQQLKLLFEGAPIYIHVYVAFKFGNRNIIRGRVLQNRLISRKPQDGKLTNFIKFIRSLLTDEQEFYELSVLTENNIIQVTTDNDGYFICEFINDSSTAITIEALNVSPLSIDMAIINENAVFSIISDIDDTILQTGVTSFFKWKLLLNTLFRNPWKRKSFQNISSVYNEITANYTQSVSNIFYISNSPWNLQPYLMHFLRANKFPDGQLILRDASLSLTKTEDIDRQNKYLEVMRILNLDNQHRFILIGDSGEIDADIYLKVAEEFPDRIIGIFIRDLEDEKRRKRILQIGTNSTFKSFHLFKNSRDILRHIQSFRQ